MFRIHSVPSATALIALLALALIPYGGSAASPRCELRAAREDRVLRVDKLANWEPIDDRTVLIWTDTSTRAYLVRLARPLDDLTYAPILALLDGDGDRMISPCGDDAVKLGDGQDAEAAPIVSIERLSEKRTAELDPGAQSLPSGSKRI